MAQLPPVDRYAPPSTRLNSLDAYVKAFGFNPLSDVFQAHLSCNDIHSECMLSIWFGDGGFTELVRAFIGFRKPANLSKDKGLCELLLPQAIVGEAVDREMNQICKQLAKPLATYAPADISGFSFQALQLQDNAPLLHQLLTAVAIKNEPEENTNDGQGTKHRNKAIMVDFSLSVLAYARTKNANLVQGNMGYFLNATCTGKRTVDVLHQLGVSISYESVLRMEKVRPY